MKKTRFVLIGGFLGAGKTTLIGQLAERYLARGQRVGVITNDQAADLVDTHNLRSRGFNVGEVSGACFCCSFNELVSTADRLGSDEIPDVLLAEPVGSCTDLVATVILPLQQRLGQRFELAPFGVLLKPSHGKRILAGKRDGSRSGFSPQAEYIFRKQLEEADYVMIGRQDELSEGETEALRTALAEAAGDVPIFPVSPKTGHGVDAAIETIESALQPGRRLLEIDYDTYADGEAELGWVNMTAMLRSDAPVELDSFAQSLVAAIGRRIVESGEGEIAHLKASVLAGDTQSVANVVSNDAEVELGLASGRSVAGSIQTIVNARVAIDPAELESICGDELRKLAGAAGMQVDQMSAHSLRPGRPTPTHRVTAQA